MTGGFVWRTDYKFNCSDFENMWSKLIMSLTDYCDLQGIDFMKGFSHPIASSSMPARICNLKGSDKRTRVGAKRTFTMRYSAICRYYSICKAGSG